LRASPTDGSAIVSESAGVNISGGDLFEDLLRGDVELSVRIAAPAQRAEVGSKTAPEIDALRRNRYVVTGVWRILNDVFSPTLDRFVLSERARVLGSR
jgi:hypothetical protein